MADQGLQANSILSTGAKVPARRTAQRLEAHKPLRINPQRMLDQSDSHDPGCNFTALRRMDQPRPELLQIERKGEMGWIQLGLPRSFVSIKISLPIANLSPGLRGFRIVHLSDLHLRPKWCTGYDRLVEYLAKSPPDLLLFTGDFVQDRFDLHDALPTVQRLLPQLSARQGVYGILGNHDSDLLAAYLRPLNVTLLTGKSLLLQGAGHAVELIGLPGPARTDLDHAWLRELPRRSMGVSRIVLAHYPDMLAPAQALDSDLYLCGHTHGGQICLPNGRPLISHDGLPKRFARGLHRVGPTWLNVSRGFGHTGIPVRMFCPPELTEFRLISDD